LDKSILSISSLATEMRASPIGAKEMCCAKKSKIKHQANNVKPTNLKNDQLDM
jgi:hypothetical protein